MSEEGEKVGMDRFTLNEIAIVLEEHMDLIQDHPNDRQLEMTHHRQFSSQLTLKRGEGGISAEEKEEVAA